MEISVPGLKIDDLPNETLFHIFSFLRKNSAFLGEVSKRWRNLVLASWSTIAKIPIFLSSIESESLIEWAKKRNPPKALALLESRGELEKFLSSSLQLKSQSDGVLRLAVKKGYLEIVKHLDQKGYHWSGSLLVKAIKYGQFEVFSYLLQRNPRCFSLRCCFALGRHQTLVEKSLELFKSLEEWFPSIGNAQKLQILNGVVSSNGLELYLRLIEMGFTPNCTTWHFIPPENFQMWSTLLVGVEAPELPVKNLPLFLPENLLARMLTGNEIVPCSLYREVKIENSNLGLVKVLIERGEEEWALDCFATIGGPAFGFKGKSKLEILLFKANRVDLMLELIKLGFRYSQYSKRNLFLYATPGMIRTVDEAGYFRF